MPRTKEQYMQIREEKRTIIKDIALKLFADKGFEATSISEIAKNAELSKGLLYNYFNSKEDLLKEIWNELLIAFNNIVDINNSGKITDSEAEFFIDNVFEMCKSNRNQWKLYYQLSFQPKVLEYLMKIFDSKKVQERQILMLNYFAQKLNFADAKGGFFTVLVFIKGLSMVTTYTENVFDNDFLDKYKIFLKQIIFKKKYDFN
jgi:AcrR family transcriptional regulator